MVVEGVRGGVEAGCLGEYLFWLALNGADICVGGDGVLA